MKEASSESLTEVIAERIKDWVTVGAVPVMFNPSTTTLATVFTWVDVTCPANVINWLP
jgi:hypothetical protein